VPGRGGDFAAKGLYLAGLKAALALRPSAKVFREPTGMTASSSGAVIGGLAVVGEPFWPRDVAMEAAEKNCCFLRSMPETMLSRASRPWVKADTSVLYGW
jgi:predicted acylesterase/phospholipase RssA